MKFTEWLDDEDKRKGSEIFAALLALVAGAVWVYLDGFTGETIAQVTTTLSTAAVILVTFVNRMKRQEVTNFVDAGSKALSKLQKEYPEILSGPRYSKRNKEDFSIEEATADERKYLFIQKDEKGKEAQFIPVMSFKKAIVAVFLGSWALRIATMRPGAPIPKEIEDAKEAMKNAIIKMVEREFPALFEEIEFDPEKTVNVNLCIALAVKDGKITVKKFELAVYKIGKTAIETITSENKGRNNG